MMTTDGEKEVPIGKWQNKSVKIHRRKVRGWGGMGVSGWVEVVCVCVRAHARARVCVWGGGAAGACS